MNSSRLQYSRQLGPRSGDSELSLSGAGNSPKPGSWLLSPPLSPLSSPPLSPPPSLSLSLSLPPFFLPSFSPFSHTYLCLCRAGVGHREPGWKLKWTYQDPPIAIQWWVLFPLFIIEISITLATQCCQIKQRYRSICEPTYSSVIHHKPCQFSFYCDDKTYTRFPHLSCIIWNVCLFIIIVWKGVVCKFVLNPCHFIYAAAAVITASASHRHPD